VTKTEVAKILLTIKENYPSFDASKESVDRHLKYLKDFPFDVARENVHGHILTEKFPPTIADIRGRLGEQLDRQRMQENTDSFLSQLDNWSTKAAPPPSGLRRKIHEILDR